MACWGTRTHPRAGTQGRQPRTHCTPLWRPYPSTAGREAGGPRTIRLQRCLSSTVPPLQLLQHQRDLKGKFVLTMPWMLTVRATIHTLRQHTMAEQRCGRENLCVLPSSPADERSHEIVSA